MISLATFLEVMQAIKEVYLRSEDINRKEILFGSASVWGERAKAKLAICTELASRCMLPKTPSK